MSSGVRFVESQRTAVVVVLWKNSVESQCLVQRKTSVHDVSVANSMLFLRNCVHPKQPMHQVSLFGCVRPSVHTLVGACKTPVEHFVRIDGFPVCSSGLHPQICNHGNCQQIHYSRWKGVPRNSQEGDGTIRGCERRPGNKNATSQCVHMTRDESSIFGVRTNEPNAHQRRR